MGGLSTGILATNVVLIVLSLTAIACRLGRRIVLLRSSSWHDVLITIAAISATSFSILQIVSTRYGNGQREAQVPRSNMETILQLTMASRIFYFLCNWAVKHSLLLFYATLTVDYWPRLSINFMHAIAFSFGITNISITIFQCTPVRKMWHPSLPGHCVNESAFNYFNSSFMLATDIVLYAMPLVFTWKLHVSRPQRIAVNLLFTLGGLVLAASGARVYFVHRQATTPDFTYQVAMTMVCAVIENHLAIIVACAPSIKVILLTAFPSLAVKFERLVSKDMQQRSSEFSDSAIGTMPMIGVGNMMAWENGFGAGIVGDCVYGERKGNERKRWNPPSSWEVNKEGVDEGV